MDGILTTILSVILSASVSAIVGAIIKHIIEKQFEKEREVDECRKQEELELMALREQQNKQERRQVIEELLKQELNPLVDKVDSMVDILDKNSKGTVTLLRERMMNTHDCMMRKKFATRTQKFVWHELYDEYADMGGNNFKDFVDDWKRDIDALPESPTTDTSDEIRYSEDS